MEKQSEQPQPVSFLQRLDFYYQTIAIYAIVLLAYSVLRGTIEGSSITIRLIDPISILLVIFILGTTMAMLFEIAQKREIVIADDSIIFKSRNKSKTYKLQDIVKIVIKQDKTFHFRSNYRTCLIKVTNRIRPIRIRFSSYQNDAELAEAILKFRKNLKQ